ncbi:MAG: alpha amylase C-terminal domain-containing protein [Dysgonomonas sp.]
MLNLIENDPWLEPYKDAIQGRYDFIKQRKAALTNNGKTSLSEFASGYLYFGLHKTNECWVLREWAPNAKEIYLIGTFNDWQTTDEYRFSQLDNGNWEICLPLDKLHHEDIYKLNVVWEGGSGERIPAWTRRVVQDSQSGIFNAQVWDPQQAYWFKNENFSPDTSPLLIYECHIGMATQNDEVGTYENFRTNILPRIKADGYNAIQIMAIQEHPYYGSFGYHVSSFFAASSRFGTPDELKHLVDDAHAMGLSVIMDIVHSHAVKNEVEGLGRFDGTPYQYFHGGSRREHSAWDSLCFNYGKDEVIHFLLSNCKFWLDEYKFDGFRFDGVTSMLYYSHGLGDNFLNYSDYYNGNEDDDAICYLTLANELIHEVNSQAITIAEEVSGMPGLVAKQDAGGYGFDYRMAMNIPDYWIKIIKEKKDDEWKPSSIFWELTNRRADEKTISYAESHDQALVGDKTIIFRLIDSDMYWHMSKLFDTSYVTDRGIALHKMIRLATASTINGGYLNFMGNEFGHPEWIDFPREGNGWSYKYARRQWSLVDDTNLKYKDLGDFDKAMLNTITSIKDFEKTQIVELWHNDGDQILAFMRGSLVFVFNFSPSRSFQDYGFLAPSGKYKTILNTDDSAFGGNNLVDDTIEHFTIEDQLYIRENKGWLKLYIPARSAFVLTKVD